MWSLSRGILDFYLFVSPVLGISHWWYQSNLLRVRYCLLQCCRLRTIRWLVAYHPQSCWLHTYLLCSTWTPVVVVHQCTNYTTTVPTLSFHRELSIFCSIGPSFLSHISRCWRILRWLQLVYQQTGLRILTKQTYRLVYRLVSKHLVHQIPLRPFFRKRKLWRVLSGILLLMSAT